MNNPRPGAAWVLNGCTVPLSFIVEMQIFEDYITNQGCLVIPSFIRHVCLTDEKSALRSSKTSPLATSFL